MVAGTTLREAIAQSRILETIPGLELRAAGVFGQVRGLDEPVAEGERVEIYRPLEADPKEVRRRRAEQARRGRRG